GPEVGPKKERRVEDGEPGITLTMGNGHPPRPGAARTPRGRPEIRALRAAAIVFGLALAGAVLLAPLLVSGPRLGRLIERNLPALRGEVRVGGGNWTWPALWALWRGKGAPFALTDVRMLDPEGTEVFRARRLTGTVDWQRTPLQVTLHGLRVEDAAWRFARMRTTPGIGFLAALLPRQSSQAARRAPVDGGAAPVVDNPPVAAPGGRRGPGFRIADARLEGLQATFVFPDWELLLNDVHASGALAFDGSRGAKPAFTFDVAKGDVRGGGRLGIQGGPTPLVIPLERAWLNRMATTSAAVDTILLDAAPVMISAGANASFSGRFSGVYGNGGPQPPPGIAAKVQVRQAAPALRAVIESLLSSQASPSAGISSALLLSGRDARLNLELSGPFSGLSVASELQGLDVAYRGFALHDIALRAAAAASTGTARLDGLTATSPGGGTMSVSGAFNRRRATATVTFHEFALAATLPPVVRAVAAGTLQGVLAGELDVAALTARVDALTLALTRPAGAAGPHVIRLQTRPSTKSRGARGTSAPSPSTSPKQTIVLPEITASLWGGTLSVHGDLALGRGLDVDLRLDGRNISAERVLGARLVQGTLSFQARVQGTPALLAARVRPGRGSNLRLFGERFALPASFAFRLAPADGALTLLGLRLTGVRGGQLNLGGSISVAGLDLSVEVRRFPFGALPAFADADLPLAGMLTGQVRLTGGGSSPAPLAATGALTLGEVTFQGRSLGGGSLVISSGPGGALRARGQLVEGIMLDGSLTPAPRGLSGVATLGLHQVRLDPFLQDLPGGLRAAGLITGTATVRLGPDVPPTIDARLSALALTLSAAPAKPAETSAKKPSLLAAHSIELHARQDVVMFAQPGRAIYRLDEARFQGNAGWVELGGESRRGQKRGTIRGRLDLAALSRVAADLPGTRDWGQDWEQDLFRNLSGTMDLDLKGEAPPDRATPLVTGSVGISAQTNLRVADLSLSLRTAAGRVDLDGRRATINLPVTMTVLNANGGAGGKSPTAQARLTGGCAWPPTEERDVRLTIDLAGDVDAGVLARVAPAYVREATGLARVSARLRGTATAPQLTARASLAGITFTRPGLPPEPVRILTGQLDADQQMVVLGDFQAQIGRRPAYVTIGATNETPPAIVRFPPYQPGTLTEVDIPVQARGVSFSARTAVIDDARFALRIRGQPGRSLHLTGDIDRVKARVGSRPAEGLNAGISKTPAWLNGPDIQNMPLDLHLHSRGGAITVDVPYAPDVRVDVDYHVSGTPQRVHLSGDVHATGIYSALALSLYRLFQ
ncbi:MAG: hypothetical protein ABJA82_15745, partial [Myxococcales bacterium]